MKCHAGVEFPSGKPCPKCNAELGEVCWPGINADLLEVVQLRHENERLREALKPFADIAQFVTETQRDSRPVIFGMDNVIQQRMTIGHLRAARAALSPAERKAEARP